MRKIILLQVNNSRLDLTVIYWAEFEWQVVR